MDGESGSTTWNEEATRQLLIEYKKNFKAKNDKFTKKHILNQKIADALKPYVSYLKIKIFIFFVLSYFTMIIFLTHSLPQII